MKYFKKLMLVILLSNMMIFAEGDLHFQDELMTKHPASSAFSSQQPPVFYGQPIIGMFYFMYVVVAESFYARVMSFSFSVKLADIKRSDGVLNLSGLDDNVLAISLPVDCIRQSTLSPCFFIGSPLSSPLSSPQRPGARKRATSNSYMTTAEMF